MARAGDSSGHHPSHLFSRAPGRLAATIALASALVVVLAIAASLPGNAKASATGLPAGCDTSFPVAAYRAYAGSTQPASAAPPVACASATGYATSETTLAVNGDGSIFFSPAGSENSLARSSDGGATWSLVQPTHMQKTSLWNTVDPQVVVDPRTGRVFWVRATHTDELSPPLLGGTPLGWELPLIAANAHGFQVYSTENDGGSWTTADDETANTGDWEKLFVGPAPPASTGAQQPAGYPDVVYVCANSPAEVVGPTRGCYKSLDGGVTFSFAGDASPDAYDSFDGAPPVDCPALAANTGVVAADGTIYIPQSCANGTYLAVSSNEGATYRWLPVPGAPSDAVTGAVVQLAMDQSGALYMLWSAADRLELTRSTDQGQSWNAPLTVSPSDLHDVTLPALAAGPSGHVGVSYYASTNPSSKMLSAYISETSDALDASPLFYAGAINDPAHPIFENYGDTYTPRADFIGATYDASGTLWAGVVKQLGPPDEANTIPTSGYVGRLAFG